MTRQEILDALTAEAFGPAVKQWHPAHRGAPIAELLDLLANEQDQSELTIVREVS